MDSDSVGDPIDSTHSSAGDTSRVWAPPSSSYETARQREFGRSRLTLDGKTLTWEPHGLPYGAPGSKPFSCRLGDGPAEASELVWIHGHVAPSRGQGLQVNLIAVCADDPASPGARRVLGYVAGRLADPRVDSVFEVDDAIGQRSQVVQGIAAEVGLRYAEVEVEYGDRIDRTFPGSAPRSLFYAGWAIGLIYVLGWGVTFPALAIAGSEANPWVALGAVAFGTVFVVLGVRILPPRMAARERRRKARLKK